MFLITHHYWSIINTSIFPIFFFLYFFLLRFLLWFRFRLIWCTWLWFSIVSLRSRNVIFVKRRKGFLLTLFLIFRFFIIILIFTSFLTWKIRHIRFFNQSFNIYIRQIIKIIWKIIIIIIIRILFWLRFLFFLIFKIFTNITFHFRFFIAFLRDKRFLFHLNKWTLWSLKCHRFLLLLFVLT